MLSDCLFYQVSVKLEKKHFNAARISDQSDSTRILNLRQLKILLLANQALNLFKFHQVSMKSKKHAFNGREQVISVEFLDKQKIQFGGDVFDKCLF